jgi:N-ethylmaleimide reductase
MSDPNPKQTFPYLAANLRGLGIAYLHMVESLGGGRTQKVPDEERMAPHIREVFKNTLILNGGYLLESANRAIRNNGADLLSFGESYLANPDLPYKFKAELPLNVPNPATYYTGEEAGYTDYPVSAEQATDKQCLPQ